MGFFGALPILGQLGGGILGALLGNSGQNWYKGATTNVLNQLDQAISTGLQNTGNFFNPLSAYANTLLGAGQNFLLGPNQNNGALQNFYNNLNNVFSQVNPQAFRTPYGNQFTDYANTNLGTTANALGGLYSNMNDIAGNRGVTPQSSYLNDRLTDMGNGQGAQLGTMGDYGMNVLGARGLDPFNQGLEQHANQVVQNEGGNAALNGAESYIFNKLMANGGLTPGLSFMDKTGQQTLGGVIPGLTPTGGQGEQTALGGLAAGGNTPYTNLFQSLGAKFAAQPSVIPMELAVGLARDNADQATRAAAERMEGQAMLRGGGPGATVANGAANSALADFANQGAQNESNAIQQALAQQQGFGLQQQNLGSNMGLEGGNLSNARLGISGNLLASLEGTANQRYGIGGNLMQGAEGLANSRLFNGLSGIPALEGSMTNRANVYGNLGLGGAQNALGQVSLGGNLLNDFNNIRLSALNNDAYLQNLQNQYGLGAGQLVNNIANNQANMYNNMFGNQLSAGQLGMNQANSYFGAFNPLLSQMGNAANMGSTLMNMGMSPLYSMGSDWIGYARAGLGGLPGILNPATANNPMATWLQGAGSKLGGDLGGYFGGMTGGGGGGVPSGYSYDPTGGQG